METLTKNSVSITNLYPVGMHGIEHSFKVYLLIQKLCEIELIGEPERIQLEFCAFFHDIGRVNDLVDDTHGIKSFKKLKKYIFFGLKKFNNSFVQYIIENHCLNDKKAIDNSIHYQLTNYERAKFLILLFKDADSLDRFRLGDFDKKYLRNSSAEKLIDLAMKINSKTYSNEHIYKYIHSWLERNFKA